MRVLFLTNIPTPYRVDFFNELGKYCDLTVLYERKSASDRDKSWKSENAKTYKAIFLNGKNTRSDAAICFNVVKWLQKDKFDIIVIGGYSTPTGMLAIQFLKMKNIPFVLNSDGGFIKQDKKCIYSLKKYFISSAKWWLSTGNKTNEYLKYYGANEENIYSYPFTTVREKDILNAPLSNEEKNKLRNSLGLNYNKIAISVGRYIYSKGYDILIDAWRNIEKDYLLIIIGSGEKEKELQLLINDYNLKNVKLIGFKQKEELKKYYMASDVFILPTRSDVWGLVINEAISYGIPVITTNKCIAGLEIIENGVNGFLVDINDLDELEKCINVTMKDDNLNKLMSIENINKSKQYTIEKMAKKHYLIFKNIYLQNKN